MQQENLTIKRIIKVNHAGEYGAIRIYKAQIFLARYFYKDLLPHLEDMLSHEIDHCQKFQKLMVCRSQRPCLTMWLWSYGGALLGFCTGLLGRNMVMVCTEAVEDAVHKHMNDQVLFLERAEDDEVLTVIKDIQAEELQHLKFAQDRVSHNFFTKIVSGIVALATEIVIALSTHGDSLRLNRTFSN